MNGFWGGTDDLGASPFGGLGRRSSGSLWLGSLWLGSLWLGSCYDFGWPIGRAMKMTKSDKSPHTFAPHTFERNLSADACSGILTTETQLGLIFGGHGWTNLVPAKARLI
jgi:hypothetical protein